MQVGEGDQRGVFQRGLHIVERPGEDRKALAGLVEGHASAVEERVDRLDARLLAARAKPGAEGEPAAGVDALVDAVAAEEDGRVRLAQDAGLSLRCADGAGGHQHRHIVRLGPPGEIFAAEPVAITERGKAGAALAAIHIAPAVAARVARAGVAFVLACGAGDGRRVVLRIVP